MARHGTWTETGGGSDLFGVLVALAPYAIIGVICYFTAQAVAAIPVYVWVLAVIGIIAGAVFTGRRTRRRAAKVAAQFAASCAEREAIEEARAQRRREVAHQRNLEIAAASAPVINNHVWTPEAIEAMRRGRPAPTVVVGNAEESKWDTSTRAPGGTSGTRARSALAKPAPGAAGRRA